MPNKKLVILGGGTAGWMTANLLAHQLKNQFDITVIEAPDVGTIGVGEGSTPTLKRFFTTLGISEHEWMPQCNATYKTNIKFTGWSPKSGDLSYSHPFISQVDTFTQRAFIVNCRTRRLGLDTHTRPDDFFLNSRLAQAELAPVTPENFPFRMEYGYHFDSVLLGAFLTEYAVKQGVVHTQAHIQQVNQTPSGDIESLVTDDGQIISGHFFIDCSGFSSVLMQKTLAVKFNSFKQNLFNDSAVVLATDVTDKQPVQTESVALSKGWCWHIPLTNRIGNGYVYSADFMSAESAERELRAYLNVSDDSQPARHLKMKVGQLQHHWYKNCVAIGLSQGFIEPLEATALHLVQLSIELFIQQYQKGLYTNQYQAEYNQIISDRFERVRDYIVGHYKLNTRDDSDYWIANRANTHLSDSFLHLMTHWQCGGDVEQEIIKLKLDQDFGVESWHCLFAGYGLFPTLAANQPGKGDLYVEQGIYQFLSGCQLNFKRHADILAEINQCK